MHNTKERICFRNIAPARTVSKYRAIPGQAMRMYVGQTRPSTDPMSLQFQHDYEESRIWFACVTKRGRRFFV